MTYPIQTLKTRLEEVEQAIESLKENGDDTNELELLIRTKYTPLAEAIDVLQDNINN